MQLVYATEQRERDFRIADSQSDLPSGARVYATCTGEATVESVGETTFRTMTDGEFYALRAQVRAARERAQSARSSEKFAASAAPRRNFLGRLFGR